MSVIIFTLTEEHVKLLKNLKFSINDKGLIESTANQDDPTPSFGGNDIYESIDLILNGKPEQFEPFKFDDFGEFTDAEKATMDELYKSLPIALEVVLYNGNYDLGTYQAKFHDRRWRKK